MSYFAGVVRQNLRHGETLLGSLLHGECRALRDGLRNQESQRCVDIKRLAILQCANLPRTFRISLKGLCNPQVGKFSGNDFPMIQRFFGLRVYACYERDAQCTELIQSR